MRRHAADLALAAGFGGGAALATLAALWGEDGPSLPGVALGFGAGLLLGLAPWRRLRRWLDPRLARRPAHWPPLGLAAGLVFVFVFTGQCELQEASAPEIAPYLPEMMAAGLLGLWSAFFLGVTPDRPSEASLALTPGSAALGLGATFGAGSLLGLGALSLIYGGAPDWGDARYAAGLTAGVSLGFLPWRWVRRRLGSSRPAGVLRPVLPGAVAGLVTVAGLVGYAHFQGSFFTSGGWDDELLGNAVRGLWNACLLGFGFGHLIPDRAPAPRP